MAQTLDNPEMQNFRSVHVTVTLENKLAVAAPSPSICSIQDASVCTLMGYRISMHMSISVESPSDETLNRGPLALLLRR